jgi:hypothetical protein
MSRNPAQDFFTFILGGSLFGAGIFLFLNQVMVSGSGASFGFGRGGGFALRHGLGYGSGYGGGYGLAPWDRFWAGGGGGDGVGLLMIPMGLGVALLFAQTFRRLAWLLIWGSAAALFVGILHSLSVRFMPTSLWALVTMVVMIAAGGGLMFRSLYGQDDGRNP